MEKKIKTATQIDPDHEIYKLMDGKQISKTELEKLISLTPKYKWIIARWMTDEEMAESIRKAHEVGNSINHDL